jgi:hypothetical protein
MAIISSAASAMTLDKAGIHLHHRKGSQPLSESRRLSILFGSMHARARQCGIET